MDVPDSTQPTAYELLQEWRRLERRLASLPERDPERPALERRRDEVRMRYQQRFDSVTERPAVDRSPSP
jgi:hypothetical protein